jgi:hypothetical protein
LLLSMIALKKLRKPGSTTTAYRTLMKRLRLVYFLLLSCLAFSRCSEFIEPSISGGQVTLNAPANGALSANYTMNFWWGEVDGALNYRLQVVTPGFDTLQALVADTLIKSNKIALTLAPGNYQWRVRAENGSTQTPYSAARRFTIASSSIKQQKVQLGAPANNYLTNLAPLALSWNSLYGATRYRLQIDTNSFTDTTRLVYNQATPALGLSVALQKDQNYQWRVRAENDTTRSLWSAINTFTYDHTPPGLVTLALPLSGQTTSLPLALSWNAAPTATRYRLYVLKSDSTTVYSAAFPVQLTSTTYTLNQGSSGERLYWRVSAVDAAGNEGKPGALRNFIVQ